MTPVVQATCPGCRKKLHIPTDWLHQPIRCKHCGMVMHARTAQPAPPSVGRGRTPPPPSRETGAGPLPSQPLPVLELIQSPAVPVGQVHNAPSVGAPSPFDSLEQPEPESSSRRRRRRRHGGWLGPVVLLTVLVAAAVVTLIMWPRISRALKGVDPVTALKQSLDDKTATEQNSGQEGDTGDDPTKAPEPVRAGVPFPRRALVISVHNYLYANPVHDGMPLGKARNVTNFLEPLSGSLRIPLNQVAHLSDLSRTKSVAPTRPMIERTLSGFLDGTRSQDRVMVFFIGHAVEKGNDSYLVPIEGDLDNPATLIPLAWVYEQLAACKARQKVLVLDVCRLSPTLGVERPGSDPMGEKLDAMLQNPPPGVQVWSACVAKQQSYETENCPEGVFLDELYTVLEKGLQGRIQRPGDPIPLDKLVEAVNQRVKKELDPYKLVQVSRISGLEPERGAAYDKEEAPPPPATLSVLPPPEGGTLDRKVLEGIGRELSVPPLKPSQNDNGLDFTLLPPFAVKALEKYQAGDKQTPVREAVHKARVVLWAVSPAKEPRELAADVQKVRAELKVNLSILKDGYRVPGNEKTFKDQIMNDERSVARMMGRLTETLEKLKKAGDDLDDEPLRWKANYAFVTARVEAQIAYLYEYQSMLGQMRKELPPRDPNLHGGWKLASQFDLQGDSAGKKLAKSSRAALDKLTKDHAGTPWEVLARREKLTALGLVWKPVR